MKKRKYYKNKINIRCCLVSWGIDRERFEASLCAQVFQVINNMQPKDLVTKEAKLLELWNVQQPREIIEKGLQHTERHTKLAEIQGDTTKIAEAYIILAKYLYKWKANISGKISFLFVNYCNP